ncbi:MAG: response regulator [Lachnospiraceae bacterium]|nr:response regulator [Lachnospiraceae bacterium]
MKPKVLLTGTNAAAIDTFFRQLNNEFILMTTSVYYEDMSQHMQLFQPNYFIYCLGNESIEVYQRVAHLKNQFRSAGTYFGAIGNSESLLDFARKTIHCADFEITIPTTPEKILKRINEFAEEKESDSKAKVQHDNQTAESKAMRLFEELGIDFGGEYSEGASSTSPAVSPSPVTQSSSYSEPAAPIFEQADERKHVLVIDDDPIMLRVIKDYLHEDYEVASARSGKTAYKYLEKKSTDLILLDYEMPEENGPQVFQKLRQIPNSENVPIVFLTGVSDRERISSVISLKPAGYVLKPVDRQVLQKAVLSALNGHL